MEEIKVMKLCLSILNNGSSIEELNITYMVLFQKIKNPNKMANFLLISICNVIYKIITEVLANRLKCILEMVISPNQSNFVPKRLISTNVIIAYELMHTHKKRCNGKEGSLGLKFDMSKAYDRVEYWSFLP